MSKKAIFSIVWVIVICFTLLVPSAAFGAPPAQKPESVPIDSSVIDQLSTGSTADYWIILEAQADLSAAAQISDWNARGQYVYDQLTSLADETQASMVALLDSLNVKYTRFWIANAIFVNSDQSVLDQVVKQPGVKEIAAPVTFSIPDPIPGIEQQQVESVEWNIDRIHAPQVWSTFTDTGQGIVVANIDTGVQYNHPALVGKYRGTLSPGVYDHNYNWFDPSNVCGNPSLIPCDNNGHGTHTMGTMVGDDGSGNQIGVAPGARFIIAKGCESNSCSDTALLASGQWILAPTNLSGGSPRPDLRPMVVNNSWGGNTGAEFWYQALVQAWVASGIFPAFSNGNAGPSCGSAGSPGDYAESYASGAFDIDNIIASFSSRGPADATGITKPNIASPGVNVRSSVPTNGYASFSGTSMASPHTAATVALMWSAAPALLGDINTTKTILNQTAIDTSDLSCGGTPTNNNVWGEGRLDAFAAVSMASTIEFYSVSGYVRDASLNPIANATVTIVGTGLSDTTDATGFYTISNVPSGTYDIIAKANGCLNTQTRGLVLDADKTNFNFLLTRKFDSFGYSCQVQSPAYIEANTVLALTGDDANQQITLPFNFSLYGTSYATAWVCTNGYMNFLAANCYYGNSAIPTTNPPNAAIYPFWDDLYVDASASVRTELLSDPNRFVIEWRNVRPFGDNTRRMDYEVVLYENGQILTQYRNIAADGREQGNSATLGIENATGTVAFQYSINEAVINTPTFAVLYYVLPKAFIEGTVTDFNDGLPISGAIVKAMQGSTIISEATTGADGFYSFHLPLDTYDLEASKAYYQTESATLVLDTEDATYTQDYALKTARGEVTPSALEFTVAQGYSRTKALTLNNTGSLVLNFENHELGGGQVMANAANKDNVADLAAAIAGGYDPDATTSQGRHPEGEPVQLVGDVIQGAGDILKSWVPAGMAHPWGVGFDGSVWLSDPASVPNLRGKAFDANGNALGPSYDCPWGGSWCGDMAYDSTDGWMCSVNVGGDNGIYCWNTETGANTGHITGAFPWTVTSQRGLAYRPDDDSFYIGGWNADVLYHVAGFGSATPGVVLNQCSFTAGISGLAWNPSFGVIWVATNSPTDTIYKLDPTSCAILGTLAHPNPGYNGGGLEMDDDGNLWMIDQVSKSAYLIDSGLPVFVDVPWLSETPASGTIVLGGSQAIDVTVDATGLALGVYEATLVIQSNSGRNQSLGVPVTLTVVPPAPPTVSFTSNTPVTLGQAVVFTNTSDPGLPEAVDFVWDFGDGSATETHAIDDPVSHIYGAYGLYTVTLTAENVVGNDSFAANVEIRAAPIVSFTSNTPVVLGDPVIFTNTSDPGYPAATVYEWNFGDGTIESHGISDPISHLYATTGTYLVKLTAQNVVGSDTFSANVTVETYKVKIYLPFIKK